MSYIHSFFNAPEKNACLSFSHKLRILHSSYFFLISSASGFSPVRQTMRLWYRSRQLSAGLLKRLKSWEDIRKVTLSLRAVSFAIDFSGSFAPMHPLPRWKIHDIVIHGIFITQSLFPGGNKYDICHIEYRSALLSSGIEVIIAGQQRKYNVSQDKIPLCTTRCHLAYARFGFLIFYIDFT